MGQQPLAEADREIETFLGMMDPLARESDEMADPMLRQFLLWGGLYVAHANGRVDESELENLRSVVGRETVEATLAGGHLSPALLQQRFAEERQSRRKPLSALELHRIFSALAAVAAADGNIEPSEVAAMRDLAGTCGVSEGFIDVVLAKAA